MRTTALPLLALLSVPALAQMPPQWADLNVPTGISPSGVFSLGKMVHYLSNNTVHVWSAFTHQWTAIPVGAGASTNQTNDYLIIKDGTTWTAFAATRGRFAPLTVTAGAQHLNPIAQNNDSALVVLDAGQLHVFSGFTGRWTSRPVSGTAMTAVQRHTALLADGLVLSAYDSFSGQWHDTTPAAPVTSLSADGTAGIAVAGSTVHGFSALRGTWATAPAIPSATFSRSDDWGVFRDGAQALGFSGLRGTFASTVMSTVQNVTVEDLFGTFRTTNLLYTFSAITGTWGFTPVAASTTVRTSSAVALCVDANQLVAYSAALGTFSTLPLATSAQDAAGSCIAAVEQANSHPHLYSSLTGVWQSAPNDVVANMPRLSTTTGLMATNSGFRAYSCRTGAFVPLTTASGTSEVNAGAAPAMVWDNTNLYFFDGRRDLWLTEPRTGAGPASVVIWRTALVVFDGADAVGYATQSGRIGRITLPEPAVAWRANSESISITTQNHLLGFSALQLPNSLSQFPDFRRPFVAGATFRLHLRLGQGDVGFLGGGYLAPAPVNVPGLGQLFLNTATTTVLLALPEVDADRAVINMVVPDSAALRGLLFWFQGLVVPAASQPYLTDTTQLRIG